MMRDANNNKIRPVSNTTAVGAGNSLNSNRIIPEPNIEFYPVIAAASSSNDIMTIFLSMDLCCARVSDKSLEYLELYPQEFGHRSLYDFLIPGENQQSLSKLHRCLLDNAVQHQQIRLPNDLIRSSSEKFFASSLDKLLNIANGSLTLKQKLKFHKGRDSNNFEEMNCRFYLGGGFGADLFDASSFGQLYIVCIASPIANVISISDVIHLPPLIMNNNNDSCSTVSSPISSPAAIATHINVSSDQLSKPDDIESEGDDMMDDNDTHSNSNTPTATMSISNTSSNTIQLPLISPNQQSFETNNNNNNNDDDDNNNNNNSKSVLDRFRYNSKPPSQQFIHPNELYYLQTTSSRLSSEAIAHTTYPYLSKSAASVTAVGSGPLANYNSHFKK